MVIDLADMASDTTKGNTKLLQISKSFFPAQERKLGSGSEARIHPSIGIWSSTIWQK